ncbi:MAG: TonB-dependent receptor [Bacteroidales bacterium]|nr:TonB-dependent receptor [Bacteroidales bacterium]MCF8391050.1 TonB-dependent receptor [Bacteroidales bacterium]
MNKAAKIFLISLVLFTSANRLFSQVDFQELVEFPSKTQTLQTLMDEITDHFGRELSFNPNQIDMEMEVELKDLSGSLNDLIQILEEYGIELNILGEHIILKKIQIPRLEESLPKIYTLSGFLSDTTAGENLIGATVIVRETGKGSISNSYGFYSLSLEEGDYEIVFSYIGYNSLSLSISLHANKKLDIQLSESSINLQEAVIIYDEVARIGNRLQSGKMELAVNSIRKMPGFLGESDVIKSLQSIPGIVFYSDGSTIFHVRGGARDQNLLLIDEAPVYNPAHLLGIFSVFTPDALNSVEIYKGDMPANYGGRLSSVVDVKMKEGNRNRLSFSGNTGLVATTLNLEAPLFNKNGSFLISGRRSHLKWLLAGSNPALKELYFTDLNLKANYSLNENNRLYLSLYSGVDKLENQEREFQSGGITWISGAGNIRWNHVFGNRLFSNTSFIFSQYDYNLYTSYQQKNRWNSQIGMTALKTDFSYFLNPDNTFRFGADFSSHRYYPGNFLSGNKIDPLIPGVPEKFTSESVLYFSNEHKLTSKASIRYGLRLSTWTNRGEAVEYSYDENFQVSDTSYYAEGEKYNSYFSFEPRLSFSYEFSPRFFSKIAYTRNSQNEFLITNSISPFTSLEVWMPSGPNIRPMLADQISGGLTWKSKGAEAYIDFEVYYKWMNNYISYLDHAYMLFNPYVENQLRYGTGKSYGAELILKKTRGRWDGWFSYTFSRIILNIQDINNNNAYPSNYDKPHSLALSVFYQAKPRVKLSSNFLFSTGSPITTPTGYYYYNDYQVPFYGERNNDRLPNYHRLDIAADFRLNKLSARNEHSLRISVFNLYGRKNPFSINFNKVIDEAGNIYVPANYFENPEQISTMMYVYGTIPSLSYHFKF